MSTDPFQTPKIISPGRRRFWPWLLMIPLIAGPAWLAYDFGRSHAGRSAEGPELRIDALQRQIEVLEKECEEQRTLAARYQRASQIDRAAVEAVQKTLRDLEAERAELRQKVAVLNSLISGKVTALEISQVKLVRKEKSNEYAFEFLVSKRDKGGERVTGKVELEVEGRQNGERVTLKAGQLGLAEPLKMGFKHFQRFEGKLRVPEGFVPEQVVIRGKPINDKFKEFEKRLAWSVVLG